MLDQNLEVIVMQEAILEQKCQILEVANCKEKIFLMNIFFNYVIIYLVKI